MRSTKENAERAIRAAEDLAIGTYRDGALILEFLKAAKAKLPSEAAFERDRKRKKSKA